MNLPRRVSAGAAALIFFAIFFALPLYAAATVCTMPCCHRGSAVPTLKADLPECAPGDCSITTDAATVKAVSRYVAPAAVAFGFAPVAMTTVVDVATEQDIAPSPPPGTHDVRLLNSVFRI